jgi:adenine-specific DNA methylase
MKNARMADFEAKASPTHDKLRGGYYTPEPIADFVSDWVAKKAGSVLLEPSWGDGNILAFLAKHSSQAMGVELFPREALNHSSIASAIESRNL